MRKAVPSAVLVLALVVIPLTASAQSTTTEPYSGGTVTETTISPQIEVAANGLTVAFTAAGAGSACDWQFGDSSTGTGNPVTHTYAAEGDYSVTATCGALVLALTVHVAPALTYTGFDVLPFALAGLVLILIGGVVLRSNRRSKEAT